MHFLIWWFDSLLWLGAVGLVWFIYTLLDNPRDRCWLGAFLILWLLMGLIFVAIQPIYPGLSK